MCPPVSSPKRMLRKLFWPEERFSWNFTPVVGLLTVGGKDSDVDEGYGWVGRAVAKKGMRKKREVERCTVKGLE